MNKTEEELIWESYQYELMEKKYLLDIDDNDLTIDEGMMTDMWNTINVIGNTVKVTPAWGMEILGYIKNVSIAGASGVILAKGIATLLSFAINKMLKKYRKKESDKNMITQTILQKKIDKLDDDITIDDVNGIREKVAKAVSEKYPDTNYDKLAIVLEKVQTFLNSTFGLSGAAIGMGILYSKMGGLPDYDEVYDRVVGVE